MKIVKDDIVEKVTKNNVIINPEEVIPIQALNTQNAEKKVLKLIMKIQQWKETQVQKEKQ